METLINYLLQFGNLNKQQIDLVTVKKQVYDFMYLAVLGLPVMKIDNLGFKQQFYTTLNERQRRHFAAIEAGQLGHGGIKAASEAFGISGVTIRTALQELAANEPFPSQRARKPGGGRKKSLRQS